MKSNLNTGYFLHRSMSVILNRLHPGLRNGLSLKCLDSDDSLKYLLENPHLSLSRWGDGESMLAIGGQLPFQKNSPELMRELLDVLGNTKKLPFVVALPWRFLVKPHDAGTWGEWKHSRYICHRFADTGKPCLDAHMFRNESSGGEKRLEDVKVEQLWNTATHLIVAANSEKIFNSFASSYPGHECHYVEVPSKNAYEALLPIQKKIDEILSVLEPSKTRLLLAAGPAAKIIVARNCTRVVCYDLGHYFQHRYNLRKND